MGADDSPGRLQGRQDRVCEQQECVGLVVVVSRENMVGWVA